MFKPLNSMYVKLIYELKFSYFLKLLLYEFLSEKFPVCYLRRKAGTCHENKTHRIIHWNL